MVCVCCVIAGGCDAAVPTIKIEAKAPKRSLAIMFASLNNAPGA
jgi:hypothetical protein